MGGQVEELAIKREKLKRKSELLIAVFVSVFFPLSPTF